MRPRTAHTQIRQVLVYLAKVGLSDDQQYPILRRGRRASTEVTFANAKLVSRAMKGTSYFDVYEEFVRHRAFSVKLLDGALVQMAYAFSDDALVRHRLAYLDSPHLIPFLKDPNNYLNGEERTLTSSRKDSPMSIRFDYDGDSNRHRDVWHPKSHLTIGHYEHCRVPVSSPLTPIQFIEFVLRHFYCTEAMDFTSGLPRSNASFPRSISRKEEDVIHVVVP